MKQRIKILPGILLAVFLQLMSGTAAAQEKPPFRTIHSSLDAANRALESKDSMLALSSLADAEKLGFFDLPYLSGNTALISLLETSGGRRLKRRIQQNYHKLGDPKKFRIHTEDIGLFWNVYEQYKEPDAEKIFLEQYIKKGSDGLKTFYQVRMRGTTAGLVKKIREEKKLYDGIEHTSMVFKAMAPGFKKVAFFIKEIYPDAIFPPLYFFIGQFSNVGTPDGHAGMLIGTEHLCRTPETDSMFKGKDELQVMFRPENALPIIIHELFHIQQKNPQPNTLLDYAISEGAADFLTYLVTQKLTDQQVYDFGERNEASIKEKFKREMSGTNIDDWLFNGFNAETKWPANMAYFIGFKICRQYYEQSKDKRKAIRMILELKDYERFVKLSGYLDNA